jgi:hypothetical protein
LTAGLGFLTAVVFAVWATGQFTARAQDEKGGSGTTAVSPPATDQGTPAATTSTPVAPQGSPTQGTHAEPPGPHETATQPSPAAPPPPPAVASGTAAATDHAPVADVAVGATTSTFQPASSGGTAQAAAPQPKTIPELLQRLKELARARQDLDQEEKALRVQIQKELLKQQESLEGVGIHSGKVPFLEQAPVNEVKLLEKVLDRLDQLEKRVSQAEKPPAAQLTGPPPTPSGGLTDEGTAPKTGVGKR